MSQLPKDRGVFAMRQLSVTAFATVLCSCFWTSAPAYAEARGLICKPVDVAISWDNTLTIRCKDSFNGVIEFEIRETTISLSRYVNRALAVALSAQAAEKTVAVVYDENDSCPGKADCRLAGSVALSDKPAGAP
jgi:hypothetical protein